MKKLTALILLLLLLTSCGRATPENTENRASNSQDSVSDASGSNQELPVYTPEDDALAASYLTQCYNLTDVSNKPKVILDSDMTFLGDDAMAMCILVQADTLGLIDLLGITVTGGNSCVAAEANAVLKQLECIRRDDIPVYMGTDEPINGYRDIAEQENIVGSIQHWGLFYRLDDYIEPSSYHDLGNFYERAWGYSVTDPQNQSSVEFMTEQVRNFPGEITILSIGAPTNIALACLEDETFASNTAGIFYVGTNLSGSGTYTPYADFNCFYDPDAFEICLTNDFPRQVIIPHDVTGDAVLNKAVFDLLDSKTKTAISTLWLDHQYSLYRRTPTRTDTCSDAIASVVFLNPSVITNTENHYFMIHTDVVDERYGSITIYESAVENPNVINADFILSLDTAQYWDFVTDLLSHTQNETPFSYSEYAVQNESH